MKILVLPTGPQGPQHTVSYAIDGRIAIDAGCLGMTCLEIQRSISHVFLTHSHIDHIGSLPIFLDNVFDPTSLAAPQVYANEPTWTVLNEDVFNERVWPDLHRIALEEVDFFHPHDIAANQVVEVDGYKVIALQLEHVVPTLGYVVTSQQGKTVAIISDTGPTNDVWERLERLDRLDAVLLDIAFPNRMEWLAEKSQHLCPRLVAGEVAKLQREVCWYGIHLKPAFAEEIEDEMRRELPFFQVVQAGDEITV